MFNPSVALELKKKNNNNNNWENAPRTRRDGAGDEGSLRGGKETRNKPPHSLLGWTSVARVGRQQSKKKEGKKVVRVSSREKREKKKKPRTVSQKSVQTRRTILTDSATRRKKNDKQRASVEEARKNPSFLPFSLISLRNVLSPTTTASLSLSHTHTQIYIRFLQTHRVTVLFWWMLHAADFSLSLSLSAPPSPASSSPSSSPSSTKWWFDFIELNPSTCAPRLPRRRPPSSLCASLYW